MGILSDISLKDDGLGLGATLGVNTNGVSLLLEICFELALSSFCFSLLIVDYSIVCMNPCALESYADECYENL